MEKKKLKLTISGSSKKTFSSIEQAKTQSKNAVFIERKGPKSLRKNFNNKPQKSTSNFRPNPNFIQKKFYICLIVINQTKNIKIFQEIKSLKKILV